MIRSLLAVVVASAMCSVSSSAATILLDLGFNTVDPSAPYATQIAQDGTGVFWNTTMWNDTDRPFDRTDVVDITGATSDIDVEAISGVYGSGGQNAGVVADAGLGLLAQDRAVNDYISSGSSFSFKLTDLDAGTTYDLTLYGSRASGTRTTNFNVTDGNSTFSDEQQVGLSDATTGFVTLPNGIDTGNAADFIDLTVFAGLIPDANGEITIEAVEGGGSFAYLNIVQIDTFPVPEPSSMVLAGLGGLLILKRRR